MKSITVQSLTDMFHLEVLAGANCMDRLITRPQTHRPGLEFVGYFDFFPMERVQVLGRKEINYLLTLSIEERKLHIGNIVKYHPPCFIVTSGQQEISYLTLFCDQEGIPLLRTAETTT
ncbi:HPr(Ser) kinase/phosphatase, partial [Paenibacillus glucanolyticus]